jgi:hypothetical protein
MPVLSTLLAGLFLLFSFSQGAAALDPAPAQVGRVSAMEGRVQISYGEDGGAGEAASVNYPVGAGARISAGPAGRAEIEVGPNAIRVQGEALLDVVTLEDRAVRLRLDEGALNLALRDVAPDGGFEVATPHASISIQLPGSYRIDADPAGSTRVSVRSGEALLRSDAGEILLKSGRGVDASQAGLFEFDAATAYALDDFDRWCHARAAESSGSYSGHVPREVTGYQELDRSGTWSSYSGYGTVWTPGSAYDGWAPYTHGYWAWVPSWGWTWVDHAPWAFATYRFGHWAFLDGRWWWVPGAFAPRPVFSGFVPFRPGQIVFTTSFFVHGKPAHHFVPLKPREVIGAKRFLHRGDRHDWRRGATLSAPAFATSTAAPPLRGSDPTFSGPAPVGREAHDGFRRGSPAVDAWRAGARRSEGRPSTSGAIIDPRNSALPATMGGGFAPRRGENAVPLRQGGGGGDSAWQGGRRWQGAAPAMVNPQQPFAGSRRDESRRR